MTTVAVTGAAGPVGREVAARVGELDGVEVRPVGDVLDPPALASAFQSADVVIHLASQVDPLDDDALTRAINVDGTRNVFEAAAAQGVGHVVHRSTVVVYGAHPDNDVPLTEDSPLRANPDFPYVEGRRDAERWIEQWAPDHPEVAVTVLRLGVVVGAGAENFVVRTLQAPRIPAVRGHRPPIQLVHVDDVAFAFAHVVEHSLSGSYNVAAEGWLSFDEFEAILGRRILDLPEEIAFTTVERLAAVGLTELPVGAVHYLMHPWVVSVDRLVATGWRPRHSNRDAAARLAEELGDRLVIGPIATSRHQVRQVASVSLGVAGGVLALGLLARRRRRRDDDT